MFWGPTGPDDDQPNAQYYRVIRILIRVQTRSSRSCVIFHSRKVAAVIHRQTPGWSCHKSHGNSGDSVRNIGRGVVVGRKTLPILDSIELCARVFACNRFLEKRERGGKVEHRQNFDSLVV